MENEEKLEIFSNPMRKTLEKIIRRGSVRVVLGQ